jgi:hypothetical protein
VPSRMRRTIGSSASERAFKVSTLEGEAVLSRLARASAEEEIDEATGKFPRPRTDIAHLELLACANRANKMSAARFCQSANFDRGGNCRPAEPARTSGLSERDCSHLSPPNLNERAVSAFTSQNLTNDGDGPLPNPSC